MKTALFALLLTLVLAQQKLNYLESQSSSVTVEQLVEKFTELQPELYRKVFQHYIVEQIAEWKSKGWSQGTVRDNVLELLTKPTGPLMRNLNKYMQDKLFSKLEMGSLVQSLQEEIKSRPQNFYLTFDIYDLLFD